MITLSSDYLSTIQFSVCIHVPPSIYKEKVIVKTFGDTGDDCYCITTDCYAMITLDMKC